MEKEYKDLSLDDYLVVYKQTSMHHNIKYSYYIPSKETLNVIRRTIKKKTPFAEDEMVDDVRAVLSNFHNDDTWSEMDKDGQEIWRRMAMIAVAELSNNYIKEENYEVDVNFHAADRYTWRYSNEYHLYDYIKGVPKEDFDNIKPYIAKLFRRYMYPMLLKIYKKGKDPYKIKKINPELAAYVEHKKKLHNEPGIKVKVYNDSIWVFKMIGKVALLKTMYAIPRRFGYVPPEDEVLKPLYDFLIENNLLYRKLLLGDKDYVFYIAFGDKGRLIDNDEETTRKLTELIQNKH